MGESNVYVVANFSNEPASYDPELVSSATLFASSTNAGAPGVLEPLEAVIYVSAV